VSAPLDFRGACPAPRSAGDTILLGHGGGGRLMGRLLHDIILPAFDNPLLAQRHDGAVFPSPGERLALTTDSFVVKPLFFPGGDIGRLAVHGTLNDLAMCGAEPRLLSVGLIIEEGLSLEALRRVVGSMRAAADAAGVLLATGDTKVVERGKGDGLFVNTAGIGVVISRRPIGPAEVRPGDVVVLNGDIGRHGMAVMAQREGLAFDSTIESDTADLSGIVRDILAAGAEVHCLRDCTRGGLGAALIEIAETAGVTIRVTEAAVAVSEPVRGACELLGLDPLYVANEGRFIAIAPAGEADRILAVMRAHPLGTGARAIGAVSAGDPVVTLDGMAGPSRLLDLFTGEQLPRIC
jgi:hydrogenase expression/formation protein HypE